MANIHRFGTEIKHRNTQSDDMGLNEFGISVFSHK